MRALLIALPFALIAAPAAAQPQSELQLPPALTDPAMAGQLGKMLGAMTRAMMDMPVGELQAAMEGREATGADKRRTLRDMAGRNPNFEREVERQVAVAVPRMQAGMKAMAKSMPAMIGTLEKAAEEMERELDRATANLPQPGYPRR